MNLSHPIVSLIPSLAGPVLEVLANTTRPLSGREVQRLLTKPASHTGIQKVLDELATHGIVDQVESGKAVLNTLNRDHILAPLIIRAGNMRRILFTEVAEIVRQQAPDLSRVLLLGSAARGDADQDSDIDLLLVWPEGVSEEIRRRAGNEISSKVGRLTGNVCRPLHYSVSEFEKLDQTAPHLHAALATEGVDLLTVGDAS